MSLSDPRDLDDLLNYRLMRLFALSGAPVIRLCEGRYGIARREWRLLALLAAHGALSPSELADRGDLDRARTSRAIGTLVAKKLVERAPLPGDARRAVVQLTPSGKRLYDDLFPQVAEINRQVLSVLEPGQVAWLEDALQRLATQAAQVNLHQAQGVQADRLRGGSRRHWGA